LELDYEQDRSTRRGHRSRSLSELGRRGTTWAAQRRLNDVCAEIEFDALMEVIKHAVTPKYYGWSIWEIMRDCGVKRTKKEFPMTAGELAPWLDL
jgi:hypothetical protein